MILDFLIDIAKTPAILVALIAILGLALQKKPAADLVKGLENFVGFIVVGGGANIIVGSLEPFGQMFEQAFNLKGLFQIMKL